MNSIWCYICLLLVATLFPVDKIIGKAYPIFNGILVLSAIGVFIGVIMDGGTNLVNLSFCSNIFV